MSEVLDLTIELCRRESITPDDAGCQALVAARLRDAGFEVESLRYGAVDNLWARHGDGAPVVVLLGHTDVVPTGPRERWSSAPFEPTIRDGHLFARGAADMKGSVAAMTLAAHAFVRANPAHRGTVAMLLTSDEEGDARDGVRRVLETFAARGQRIDHCIVGEPSSSATLGDVMRVGRRGSLHGHLEVHGLQGHVAFPDKVRNPIHIAAPALAALAARRWDEGDAIFPPTSFQVSNVHAGTGAYNVTPGELRADFNFRFNPKTGEQALRREVEAILAAHGLDYSLEWDCSGEPYHTVGRTLVDAVTAAVLEITGTSPRPDTGGGTSDGRFVAKTGAEVVELGPINATIHQIDEHVRIADLESLVAIHTRILGRLLG
ncbi:MAG TPA: succinyl-diaminopimelate desuccinylase [Candidatus Saccharimonadia bacterium]|nr:succinyl-diaminopimelate desuccinylase [Candidatus Saccharimonadia bacterium]